MCQIPSQLFFSIPVHTFLILCSLSIKRVFSVCSSLMAFNGEYSEASVAPVVQQFSFQRDRIKKLGVPN